MFSDITDNIINILLLYSNKYCLRVTTVPSVFDIMYYLNKFVNRRYFKVSGSICRLEVVTSHMQWANECSLFFHVWVRVRAGGPPHLHVLYKSCSYHKKLPSGWCLKDTLVYIKTQCTQYMYLVLQLIKLLIILK